MSNLWNYWWLDGKQIVPMMHKDEIKLFIKYLEKCTNYLEYGSGGSTIFALLHPNIKKIVTVETNKEWYQKIIQYNVVRKGKDRIQMELIDLQCIWWKYVSWSNENNDITSVMNDNWYIYQKIGTHMDFVPDLVLIDGRFRVACMLQLYDVVNEHSIILFDDYTSREQYNVVELFYEPIESVETLQVLKKKKEIDRNLLEEYKEKYKNCID